VGTLKYLYINNNVAIEYPIMSGEVESDMDGYKIMIMINMKTKTDTIITCRVSASGY
jgi:hypothetical protein